VTARLAAAAALALTTAACIPDPYLHAETPAPPGRAARLDAITGFWGTVQRYRLELSQGVAIALDCVNSGPCEHVQATSDDPAIAEVRLASFATFDHAARPSAPYYGGAPDNRPPSGLVLIGKAPGRTRVHVHAIGERDIEVTVVAPPSKPAIAAATAAPAPAATAATAPSR
jgi:hypothetical protein